MPKYYAVIGRIPEDDEDGHGEPTLPENVTQGGPKTAGDSQKSFSDEGSQSTKNLEPSSKAPSDDVDGEKLVTEKSGSQ